MILIRNKASTYRAARRLDLGGLAVVRARGPFKIVASAVQAVAVLVLTDHMMLGLWREAHPLVQDGLVHIDVALNSAPILARAPTVPHGIVFLAALVELILP